MRVECYQCDEAFPNTQPEGTGYNPAEWLLSKLQFTLKACEWFSFVIASILHKCGTSVINLTRQVCPYTQPEGTGNNSAVWLLSELLFTHRAGEWF